MARLAYTLCALFVGFFVAAIAVGQLSARAQRRAEEAEAAKGEVERLYFELQDSFERSSQAKALKQSERLKSALLDAVTHDFRTPLVDQAAVWTAATPFLATRYPKRRGSKRDRPEDYATPRDFARHVLREELRRRPDLPEAAAIDDLEWLGPHRLRPIQFQRFRSKSGDDGGRRLAGGFRITFATPIRGPLCLGHSCHFGLGLFVPDAGQ